MCLNWALQKVRGNLLSVSKGIRSIQYILFSSFKNFDSSELYYKKNVEITSLKFKKYKSFYALALLSLGNFYFEIGILDKAESKYLESYKVFKNNDENFTIPLRFLCLLYIKQNRLDEAKGYITECFEFQKQRDSNNIETLYTEIDIAELEIQFKNYKNLYL